ncbi:MAG: 4-alpha-glucanotransferase, partial [Thermoguttaceae bacterium]
MADNGRAAGILAHPTSFPSPFGIGDLGPFAFRFVDWLAGAGQRVWQILPLTPTLFDGSPYKSPSAFAGNPMLISPERLAEEGLLDRAALEEAGRLMPHEASPVDFARVERGKRVVLDHAYLRFKEGKGAEGLGEEFEGFCRAEAGWLDRHAVFMAISDVHQSTDWLHWTEHSEWSRRVLEDGVEVGGLALGPLAYGADFHRFIQFLFFRQWHALREYARRQGIRVFGDVPIYVSHLSADVWGNRHLFELDEAGRPLRVAGVPPDYFSSTGQLWGNPLYNWNRMRHDGFAWWNGRLQSVLRLVDLVRLDHFRGFEAYWAVGAEQPNAIHGEWVAGPGDDLLSSLQATCVARGQQAPFFDGGLPIVAEDLGLITREVTVLRKRFGLPGMSVLQFAFGQEPDVRFLPENVPADAVVYTGTHDNNTTVGWYRDEVGSHPEILGQLGRYMRPDSDIAWELMRLAWHTEARLAIAPLQDVFSLGSEARMNTPGSDSG